MDQGYRHGFWGRCADLVSPDRTPPPSSPDSWGLGLSSPGSLKDSKQGRERERERAVGMGRRRGQRIQGRDAPSCTLPSLTSVLGKLGIGQDLFAELESVSVLLVFVTSLRDRENDIKASQPNDNNKTLLWRARKRRGSESAGSTQLLAPITSCADRQARLLGNKKKKF